MKWPTLRRATCRNGWETFLESRLGFAAEAYSPNFLISQYLAASKGREIPIVTGKIKRMRVYYGENTRRAVANRDSLVSINNAVACLLLSSAFFIFTRRYFSHTRRGAIARKIRLIWAWKEKRERGRDNAEAGNKMLHSSWSREERFFHDGTSSSGNDAEKRLPAKLAMRYQARISEFWTADPCNTSDTM